MQAAEGCDRSGQPEKKERDERNKPPYTRPQPAQADPPDRQPRYHEDADLRDVNRLARNEPDLGEDPAAYDRQEDEE